MISNREFRHQCAECVHISGLWLEFGVYKGQSARHWLEAGAPHLYGFDTFEGLPEKWRDGYEKGKFDCGGIAPEFGGFTSVKGLIQDTLPGFLEDHPENAALVHIDTDLYSAAEFTLRTLRESGRLVQGTVVVFDELAGHEGWQGHEWKAANEELFPYFDCVPVAARMNENGCIRAAYLIYEH